ncbi:MAG: hypothetical protein L0Y66_01385 [Myxococcaceae bacterium]|nr:hypothetical protein [Myxococcaceae bacterium]MCI0672849.1 hypothetical protein [Myxococcaceae bacterium]
MAKWLIERQEDGLLRLTYVNLQASTTFHCGDLRADTPLDLIVEWIVTKGAPNPGDWIVTPDQHVLLLGSEGARA